MRGGGHELLRRLGRRRVISLVGAGGKTTLMFRLARELTRQGKRVITTTTTKISLSEARQAGGVIVAGAAGNQLTARLKGELKACGRVSLAQEILHAQGKLQGIDQALVHRILKAGICDHLIVEADGAAGRPFKAPAAHEPLLPRPTDLLIAVVGLVALGKPLTSRWVHRPEAVALLSGLSEGEKIGPGEVARVIASDQGLMKHLPPDAESWVFLNQADQPGAAAAGRDIAALLLAKRQPHPQQLLIGAAAQRKWIYQVYPLGNRQCSPKESHFR